MAAFDPLTSPVDVVFIGNPRAGVPLEATPGLAAITGADGENVIDAQQGAGTTGAPLRFRGAELVKFTITLRFWLSAHWLAWETFRARLQTPPFGHLPSPLTVVHPWLVMQNVSQALVKGVGQPVLEDSMIATVAIKMIQYKQPKVTFATVKSTPDAPLSKIDQQLKAARTTLAQQNAILAK